MRAQSSSNDLWSKALSSLDVELRNSFEFGKASRGDVVLQALKQAQEKKEVCAQQCWTFKKRSGETFILRDVVEKIIVWVEKFIKVGDVAVQYDPVHAAPAWALFRFVLQMSVNDKKVAGEVIANLETVSHLITRYAILEELYIVRSSVARDKLEDMVVRLYAEILTFLAKAKNYFQRSAKIRLAMSLVKVSEDEPMAKMSALDSQVSKLMDLFSIDVQGETSKEIRAMNDLLNSLKEPIIRLVDQSRLSTQTLEESQGLKLLQWLSPVPFSKHHKWHSKSRIPCSGQWLLDHDLFLNWRNASTSSIFLLHGIMGSGKTSLASAVVDAFLQEGSGQAPSAPTAYFYCSKNRSEPERSNPDEVLRSILRQLTVRDRSSSTVHKRVLREYEDRKAIASLDGFEIARLGAAECVRLILDVTAANPATILVDAVDEIEYSSRHTLSSALTQIVQDSLNVVKVFVTSRDDGNIYALFPNAVAIRIQKEHTSEDMEKFVRQEVSFTIRDRRMLNGAVSDDLKHDLVCVLIAGAEEMFIWVVRQIETLSRMKTEADIRFAMRALSNETLNDLYEDSYTQMMDSGRYTRDYAIQIFCLLLCVKETLSPEAVVQAMISTDAPQEETMTLPRLLDICFNLVTFDSELNVLRFAHTSFQVYLETKTEFAKFAAHKVTATSCLKMCLQGLPPGMDLNMSPRDSFHLYSSVYWAEHCRIAMLGKHNEPVITKLQEFVFEEDGVSLGFVDWIQEVSKFTKEMPYDHMFAKELNSVVDSNCSPLFTACVFGLAPIVDRLKCTADYDWNQTNDIGQSGLYLAAANGRSAIVQSLLQHEVDVNIFGGKFNHPLYAACFGGYASIVGSLLDHGANPKLGPKSALEAAISAGHEDIALLLLNSKFDIVDQFEYDSILQRTAEAGFADAVQFLQNRYASLFGPLGSSRCRAVELAILKGRTGVVERYMQNLSDPTMEMVNGAIATAALGGQDNMIRLLVDRGLNPNEEGPLGTPLRAACIMCNESTVRLLLKLGVSLHTPGSFGKPLQAAAMRGHESIIRTLLSHGADVNDDGGLYGTALQAAAHRGHQKSVEILLEAGAHVHRAGFSRDAFHAASEGGHEGIVRLLFEKGFTPGSRLHRPLFCLASLKRDLLREASPSRHREMEYSQGNRLRPMEWRERASMVDFSHVVESIRGNVVSELEVMQPYDGRYGGYLDRDRNYALRAAAAKGHATVVSELEVMQPYDGRYGGYLDRDRNYALRAAAAKGHATVVGLLLTQLDSMPELESEIFPAFQEACENGHVSVVDQFLSGHLKAELLQAGLEVAAMNGHLNVVNLLVEYEDSHGIARVRSASISETDLERRETQAFFVTERKHSYECDSTAYVTLISASKRGHLPILRRGQELVAHRCTAFARYHIYEEAMEVSGTFHKSDVMEALLDTNNIYNSGKPWNTLAAICRGGSEEVLKRFLAQDTKKMLGFGDFSAGLELAVQNNNCQIVLYWLRKYPGHEKLKIDPATVVQASEDGFINILPPLTERIRQMDSFENVVSQCLQVASKNWHAEVVEYLIQEGIDVNRVVEGESALQAALVGPGRFEKHRANAPSQKRIIETLLAKGADPNKTTEYRRLPLNIAAKSCPLEIVQALLSSGANIEAAIGDYGTALNAAVCRERGSLPVIEALLKAGAAIGPDDLWIRLALQKSLSFLETSDRSPLEPYIFMDSGNVRDVLDTGHGAAVKMLLSHLPETDAKDPRYGLLAQMACVAGDLKCVELLLRRGMDVNCYGSYYGTVLQASSRFGNIEAVDYLLDHGSDINALQGEHGTALRAAVLGGHEDLAISLIARGADVNLRFKNRNKSILHLALEAGNGDVFKALIDAGADTVTNEMDQQPIMIVACENGNTSLVELLLARGDDPNTAGIRRTWGGLESDEEPTPLHAACAKGHSSVARLLLDHGADIERASKSSATPLIAAIRSNHLSVVELLLDAGANVNHALHAIRIADATRQYPIKEDAAFTTPLSEAVKFGDLEIVSELLAAGAIIGGSSAERNELTEACKEGKYRAAGLLLEILFGTQNEADICNEALSAAIKNGDGKGVRLLQDHGVSPSLEMMWSACSTGLLEVVEMLVETGADINAKDSDATTLVHVAACYSRVNIVQFLIKSGANVKQNSQIYGVPLIAALEGCLAPFLRLPCRLTSCQTLADQLPFKESWRLGRPGQVSGTTWKQRVIQCEQIVQSMFNAGANMDMTIRSFGNALHLASYIGSENIVTQMLERTEDVNMFGGYFGSPLIAAVKGNHPTVVEMLLRRDIDINHYAPEHGSALYCACTEQCEQITRILLDYGADINFCDDKHGSALTAAASPSSIPWYLWGVGSYRKQRAIVELLLRREPKIQIRECDLLAAASSMHNSDSEHMLNSFLRHDQLAVATESVTVKFIQDCKLWDGHSLVALERLLERDKGLGTTRAMLKAADDVKVMETLLKHKPICEVTADILEGATKQFGYGTELIKLLLAHSPCVPITDATIIAVATFYKIPGLKVLLNHGKDIKITDKVLEAVDDPIIMRILLQRRTEGQETGSDILEKAAKSHYYGAKLVYLLIKHDSSLKVTPSVVHEAMKAPNYRRAFLRTILEHDPALNITDEDVISLIETYRSDDGSDNKDGSDKDTKSDEDNASFENNALNQDHALEEDDAENASDEDNKWVEDMFRKPQRGTLGLLIDHGKTVKFTDKIRKALDARFPSESDKMIKERFGKLERK